MTMIEEEPSTASSVFGDRIDIVRAFAQHLGDRGEELGLIGPLEPARLWTRHILNSGIIAPLFDEGARVADIGSGAGLPGLVLGIARPDVTWVLIEPMERRVKWLNENVKSLGLDNVTVVRARAEDYEPRASFDQVTARAVSALRTLIPLVAPLVKNEGELVLLKGTSSSAEIDAAQKQIRKFSLKDVRTEVVGEGVLLEPSRVVRATISR